MIENTISRKDTIKRIIFDYLLPRKLKILLALLMMIISAGATGLHAWLVRPALDEVLIKGKKEMLLLIPLAIILATLCKGLATYTQSFQKSKVAHSVIATLQSQMFKKLMFLNLMSRIVFILVSSALKYLELFSNGDREKTQRNSWMPTPKK